MKIKICGREEMESLIANKALQNKAVISFNDPVGRGRRHATEYAPLDFDGSAARVLQISVHDLDIEALEDFGLSFERYYPEAKKVADFVKRAVVDGLELICQCEYGQSRSAGCAAAILEYYDKNGISVFADYRYYPNQLIFNKTYEALCGKAED